MSHPRSYVWPSVVIGLLIALVVIQGTKLYHASKVEPCKCPVQVPCSCPEVTPCTCDHAALLGLHKECKASIDELRGHVEAIEDRLSKGESRILSEWIKAQDVIKSIQRRLDKLEGHSRPKPPVRRQASCGAHPPSCEGIAALGADGEPDSVTGILLCATADESTLKPCQPLRNAFRVWQTWEIEQGKRAEKRRKAWAALKLFIALQDGQAT